MVIVREAGAKRLNACMEIGPPTLRQRQSASQINDLLSYCF